MDYLSYLLLPVQVVIHALTLVVNDYGLAIILFAVLVYIAMTPIRRWGAKLQLEQTLKQQSIEPEINAIKQQFTGEKRHKEIEKLYQQKNYNPFSSLKGLTGLSIQIPILILVYHSLINDVNLSDQTFFGIITLDQSDGLFKLSNTVSINILPVIMWLFGILSAYLLQPIEPIKPTTLRRQKQKSFLISTIFLILLYQQPASVVLYWTTVTFLDLATKIKHVVLDS